MEIPLDNIKCPISMMIFKNPVVIEDGNTYEKECIEKWFQYNNISPCTGLSIANKILISNRIIKTNIKTYLENNPEEKSNQYIPEKKSDQYIPEINEKPNKDYCKGCAAVNICFYIGIIIMCCYTLHKN